MSYVVIVVTTVLGLCHLLFLICLPEQLDRLKVQDTFLPFCEFALEPLRQDYD